MGNSMTAAGGPALVDMDALGPFPNAALPPPIRPKD